VFGRFLKSLVLHVCGIESFGQMSAEIEALPGDLYSLYQLAVLPALEFRFEGRTWGTLDQIARCSAASFADTCAGSGNGGGEEELSGTEEGIVAKVLSALCDAGNEGLYLADVPVPKPSQPPFKYVLSFDFPLTLTVNQVHRALAVRICRPFLCTVNYLFLLPTFP
jgi:hypothetical protein